MKLKRLKQKNYKGNERAYSEGNENETEIAGKQEVSAYRIQDATMQDHGLRATRPGYVHYIKPNLSNYVHVASGGARNRWLGIQPNAFLKKKSAKCFSKKKSAKIFP